MENLPSSLMGYNKAAVNDIIFRKNQQIKTQQADIDFLREENKRLKRKLKTQSTPPEEPSLGNE